MKKYLLKVNPHRSFPTPNYVGLNKRGNLAHVCSLLPIHSNLLTKKIPRRLFKRTKRGPDCRNNHSPYARSEIRNAGAASIEWKERKKKKKSILTSELTRGSRESALRDFPQTETSPCFSGFPVAPRGVIYLPLRSIDGTG